MTVIQKKAYWVMPNGVKDVQYAPVKSIEFITAIQTSQFLRGNTPSPSPCSTPRSSNSSAPAFEEAAKEETEAFFTSLSTCKNKPAILSLVEPYASNYIPKSLDENLPLCLSGLYKPENLFMSYGELLKVCETCDVSVSQQQAKAMELNTKSQSKSPLWFNMRTGRITAYASRLLLIRVLHHLPLASLCQYTIPILADLKLQQHAGVVSTNK